jgi:hypothetical protein
VGASRPASPYRGDAGRTCFGRSHFSPVLRAGRGVRPNCVPGGTHLLRRHLEVDVALELLIGQVAALVAHRRLPLGMP